MTASQTIEIPAASAVIKATAPTRQILALAEEGGLRPHVSGSKRGLARIVVNGEGYGSLFGAIYVSKTTGRVVRAYLTHGNWGQEKVYEGVAEVCDILKSWIAVNKVWE